MSRYVPILAAAALTAGCASLSVPRPRPDTPASELASPGARLSAGDAVVRSALVNAAHAEMSFYDDHVQAYTSSIPLLQREGLSAAEADHVVVLHANATTYCLRGVGDGTTSSWYYTSSGPHPGLTTAAC
jgi:hypothetical protein